MILLGDSKEISLILFNLVMPLSASACWRETAIRRAIDMDRIRFIITIIMRQQYFV